MPASRVQRLARPSPPAAAAGLRSRSGVGAARRRCCCREAVAAAGPEDRLSRRPIQTRVLHRPAKQPAPRRRAVLCCGPAMAAAAGLGGEAGPEEWLQSPWPARRETPLRPSTSVQAAERAAAQAAGRAAAQGGGSRCGRLCLLLQARRSSGVRSGRLRVRRPAPGRARERTRRPRKGRLTGRCPASDGAVWLAGKRDPGGSRTPHLFEHNAGLRLERDSPARPHLPSVEGAIEPLLVLLGSVFGVEGGPGLRLRAHAAVVGGRNRREESCAPALPSTAAARLARTKKPMSLKEVLAGHKPAGPLTSTLALGPLL